MTAHLDSNLHQRLFIFVNIQNHEIMNKLKTPLNFADETLYFFSFRVAGSNINNRKSSNNRIQLHHIQARSRFGFSIRDLGNKKYTWKIPHISEFKDFDRKDIGIERLY